VSSTLRVLLVPDITKTKSYKTYLSRYDDAEFSVEPQMVLIGDSLAHDITPEIMEKCCNITISNIAIPGETSISLFARVRILDALPTDYIYLWIGTNDIGRGIDTAITLSNIEAIIEKLNTQRKVTILLIPPASFVKRDNKAIKDLNHSLLGLCITSRVRCLDLHTPLVGDLFLNNKYSRDGLHLNIIGKLKVASLIANDYNSIEPNKT